MAINNHWITASDKDRFNFVIGVATGSMPDVDEIADQLRTWSRREG